MGIVQYTKNVNLWVHFWFCFLNFATVSLIFIHLQWERGYTVQKTLRGCATKQNQPPSISMTPYFGKIWYLNGSINFQDFPNLRKSEKNQVNFGQNLAQNQADWYMNGSLFLQKLVFVWVLLQIPTSMSLLKAKLRTPKFIYLLR